MNKDLDERLLPEGEYRDASNIQISVTEGSDTGTVQNILGNRYANVKKKDSFLGDGTTTVYTLTFSPKPATESELEVFSAGSLLADTAYTLSNGILTFSTAPALNVTIEVYKIDTYNLGGKCVGSIANNETDKLYLFIKGVKTNAIIEYDSKKETSTPIIVDVRYGLWDTSSNPNPSYNEKKREGTPKNILNFLPGIKGKATSTLSGNLVDTNKNFINEDLKVGMVIANITDQTETTISSITNSSTINVVDNIFASGEEYEIFKDKKITGIAILEDFLVWTDNNSEPKIIDISNDSLFRKGSVQNKLEGTTQINNESVMLSDITLIRKKPTNAPKFIIETTAANTVPSIQRRHEEKFIRFAYRWKFKNGQYSAFSPFSEPLFFPNSTISYDKKEGYNKQMINTINIPYTS